MLHVQTVLWLLEFFTDWTKNTRVRDDWLSWAFLKLCCLSHLCDIAEQSECQGFYVPRVQLSALTQTTAFRFI